MKKIYLLVVGALMSTTMFANLQVATFEDVQLDSLESVLHLDSTSYFASGNYYFVQEVQDYGAWGVYYFGNVVSNKTSNTYDGDYDNDKSISGGAFDGDNFLVWTSSYNGYDYIMLPVRSVVPGMYVNNTPWVVDAIMNGDGMSVEQDSLIGQPFGENDYLTLVIGGIQLDLANDTSYVTGVMQFGLASGSTYIQDWTYVDLSSLGEVDIIQFLLVGSKQNAMGLTTPAYFCIDNFGAANPEGVENTNAAAKTTKMVRNGQVVILRDNKVFNVLGAEL